jgi:hypothetical protein
VTATPSSEFCAHHTELLATVDVEAMRQGRTPSHKAGKEERALRVVTDPTPARKSKKMIGNERRTVDPATVRPGLAQAAAESFETLKTSLLEAAGSAAKPVWLTVECTGCGKRSRVEAPVPDVRARVAAIELLLREGLGRPGTAEEISSPRMPATVEALNAMSWDEMQALFAATYVDELAAVQRNGSAALVREKLDALSEGERRVLREALETAG